MDRYYIEGFLDRYAYDVHGTVLEATDSTYTQRFGGAKVTHSEVLHPVEGNPQATIIADLERADHVKDDTFDCVILTQVLHYLYDLRAALGTVHRILKPGGVLLATVPGITPYSSDDQQRWPDMWRFTSASAERLATEAFGLGNVMVETHGNVLVATGLLYGLAAEDLRPEELDAHDPTHEVTIAIRAQKDN